MIPKYSILFCMCMCVCEVYLCKFALVLACRFKAFQFEEEGKTNILFLFCFRIFCCEDLFPESIIELSINIKKKNNNNKNST